MKAIQLLTLTALAVVIAACSTSQPAYQTQSQSVPPATVPPNLSNTSMQNYYPIPPVQAGATGNASANATTMPPGSQTQSQATGASAMQPPAAKAAQGGSTMSGNSLIINSEYSQAWGKVGQALQASGYKVLQQDKSLGSYYILDPSSSQGSIKVNTPIYQVRLKSAGNITEVNVLNEQNQSANGAVSSRILSSIKQNS